MCSAWGMSLEELYPLKGFKITRIIRNTSNIVLIEATSTNRSEICPYCQTPSHKRHSWYVRRPQALPCSAASVQLVLHVPR
ncbi:MAG: transposase family protein [bacterium]